MFDLQQLRFDRLRETNPDRYGKVDLAAARIADEDGPQFVVERATADEAHVVELVETLGHHWGRCGCKGFEYHDGPCSHLCAVYRAADAGLVTIPTGDATAVSVEVRDEQQELADHVSEPDVAADGGRQI